MKTNQTITARFVTALCLPGLFAMGLAICSTGCLVLPINSDSGYGRTNLNELAVQQFTPGVSTLEDVVMVLGEPDAVSSDERQAAYRSEKLIVTWIVASQSGSIEGAIHRERFYLFEFDPQARLQYVIQEKHWADALAFYGEPELHPPNLDRDNVPANLAGEQVRQVYPHCLWHPGGNGLRRRGVKYLPVISGRMFLSESNLFFISNAQFANTGPVLTLPLATVMDAKLDNHLFSRSLVLHSQPDEFNAFEICKTNAVGQDGTAMKSALEFIQSNIKPSTPGHDCEM